MFAQAQQEFLPAVKNVVSGVGDELTSQRAQSLFASIVDFLREGFSQVNVAEGLIIALIAALFMDSWRRWIPISFFATLASLAMAILVPALSAGSFHLPDMTEPATWRFLAALFVGYLIVIGVFFAIKRAFIGAQPRVAHG